MVGRSRQGQQGLQAGRPPLAAATCHSLMGTAFKPQRRCPAPASSLLVRVASRALDACLRGSPPQSTLVASATSLVHVAAAAVAGPAGAPGKFSSIRNRVLLKPPGSGGGEAHCLQECTRQVTAPTGSGAHAVRDPAGGAMHPARKASASKQPNELIWRMEPGRRDLQCLVSILSVLAALAVQPPAPCRAGIEFCRRMEETGRMERVTGGMGNNGVRQKPDDDREGATDENQ